MRLSVRAVELAVGKRKEADKEEDEKEEKITTIYKPHPTTI